MNRKRRAPAATKDKSVPPTEAPQALDRRAKIVRGLYRCMASKGFAATTLSDIAREAGMSSSHLLYYFPGKQAIIEAYYKTVSQKYMADLNKLQCSDPLAQLDAIADRLMQNDSKSDQAVLMDLYGQAVQNKVMRRMRISDDRHIRSLLAKAYAMTPRMPGMNADEAAEIAYASLAGLRATSFYDPSMDAQDVRRLLRSIWYRLAAVKPNKK